MDFNIEIKHIVKNALPIVNFGNIMLILFNVRFQTGLYAEDVTRYPMQQGPTLALVLA